MLSLLSILMFLVSVVAHAANKPDDAIFLMLMCIATLLLDAKTDRQGR